jgi:TRAP-type C4-dicarboxylate transport system permease small subunit
MQLLIRIFTAFLRAATGIAFAAMIFSVTLQVFTRSFLSASPVWTEELTRMALLFLVAAGAALAYRSGDLVGVDILADALPGRVSRALRLVSALATFAFCAILLAPARDFMAIGAMQTSPALGVRMDYIHFSILALLAGLCLMAGLRVAAMLAGRSDGRPEARIGG